MKKLCFLLFALMILTGCQKKNTQKDTAESAAANAEPVAVEAVEATTPAKTQEPEIPQAELSPDEKIKQVLVQDNAFGQYLVCKADNTFVSSYRTRGGDGYHFEGSFQIKDGVVSFSDVTGGNFGDHLIFTDNNGSLNLDAQYTYQPEKHNDSFIGCLCSTEDGSCFWSIKKIPADMAIDLNGVSVYRVYNDIYISENLKMRDTNSSKGKTVKINGCDFSCGDWVEEPREVVFKGMVIHPIAKTVETETIDGISAPWYYIHQQDHDPNGRNEGEDYYVWIFGGYVKEYPAGQMKEDPEVLRQSVESIGLKFCIW